MKAEAPHVLDERGYFWWAATPVPEDCFAPEDAVTGRVFVRANGWVGLELDSTLPREGGRLAAFADMGDRAVDLQPIRGILAGSSRSVLISGVRSNGGTFNTQGPSTENYRALGAVVGRTPIEQADAEGGVKSVRVSLAGFEDWLRLGSITYERGGDAISASYEAQPPVVYDLEGGCLELSFDILRPGSSGRRAALELREAAFLTFRPNEPISVDKAAIWVGRLEDLFVLLTNVERSLEWPTVRLGKNSTEATVYRAQSRRGEADVTWSECWTSFPLLREHFGAIVQNWFAKHERFGPGFHLYLGTRRGAQLYVEHHFMSLVWGLESLHRRNFPAAETQGLKGKIERILSQVSSRRDKQWLSGRLKHAGEPDLAHRLFSLFGTAPLEFEPSSLRKFSELCARFRNDVSHFGGPREPSSYSDLITELEKLSFALDLLYHGIILQLIGVPREELVQQLGEGPQSHNVERILDQAGLKLRKRA